MNKNPRKYSVTDHEGAEKQRLREQIVKDMHINDLAEIVKTESGRRWVYSILERCHVFHPVMTGNSYTFFYDGMRQIGLMIIEELAGVDRDLFGKMFAESFKWNEEVEKILYDMEENDNG
jgi:hypothetical protein